MPEISMKISVRPTLKSLAEILFFFDSFAGEASLDEDERFDMRLMLDEAFTNQIRHARPDETSGEVEVTLMKDERVIGILLADSGEKPDLLALVPRDLDEIRPGGLGLWFIRQSSDLVLSDFGGERNLHKLYRYLGSKERLRRGLEMRIKPPEALLRMSASIDDAVMNDIEEHLPNPERFERIYIDLMDTAGAPASRRFSEYLSSAGNARIIAGGATGEAMEALPPGVEMVPDLPWRRNDR